MGGTYRPQPQAALRNIEWPSILGDYNGCKVELFALMRVYRGQVRDFVIGLWFVDNDGKRYEVSSVDCCDGQLHRHRLIRSNPQDRLRDRYAICELNQGDEDIVNNAFDVQYNWMLDNWEDQVRRWDGG